MIASNQIRQLPSNLSAEAALLGSILLNPSYCNRILGEISAEDFTDCIFIDIFHAVSAMSGKDNFDCVMLRDWLVSNKKMDDKTAYDWLLKIAESVPSGENWEYYLNIVKTKALERQIVCEVNAISAKLYDYSLSPEDKKAMIEEAAFKIKTRKSNQPQLIGEIILQLFDEWGKHESGIKTGFRDLDFMIDGFGKGQLVVVAGRPSMGKTSLALDFLINFCRTGKRAAMFSLEMSELMVVERLVCNIAEVDSGRYRKYESLSDNEKDKIHEAQKELHGFKFWLDKSTVLTPSSLATKARLLKLEFDIDVLVIDYLQLIYSSKAENRQQEITKICAEIKTLARSLDVPIVLLSQLNRSCEQRTDKKPQLSDLRESGSIEQDADVVLLLHRPDYYARKENATAEDKGKTELIVAKNRQGQTGIVELVWLGEFFSFKNMSKSFGY